MTAHVSPPRPRTDRLYFGALAILFATLTLAGFARTFYASSLFGQPTPAPFIIFHGVLMTGWVGLYAVQTVLIDVRRTQWHKWLGYAGAGFAALIPPIGYLATTGAAIREVRANTSFMPTQLNVLGLELTQIALFTGFVIAGVVMRNRTDWHKRFMALATLCILPNTIVRLTAFAPSPLLALTLVLLSIWAVFVIAVVGADILRTGRLHPAYAWGAAIVLGAMYLAQAGSTSPAWRAMVTPMMVAAAPASPILAARQ